MIYPSLVLQPMRHVRRHAHVSASLVPNAKEYVIVRLSAPVSVSHKELRQLCEHDMYLQPTAPHAQPPTVSNQYRCPYHQFHSIHLATSLLTHIGILLQFNRDRGRPAHRHSTAQEKQKNSEASPFMH